MPDTTNKYLSTYMKLLNSYINQQDEASLYEIEQMSKAFIENKFLPEEIVNMHIQALFKLFPNIDDKYKLAMHFLLEAISYYGVAFNEVASLRDSQDALKSEIAVAASMQESLLSTTIPCEQLLDIGVKSVPASQMNGDYYHFFEGKDDTVGLLIADVVGKGVPAALCMSMIKYSLDSFPEQMMYPEKILKSLNRVVERNVDDSMFITMLCATYKLDTNMFTYASAGHEPGFYYEAQTKTFKDLQTRGLLLGVLPHSTYKEFKIQLKKGDMIILLTDGVTESKRRDEFIERQYLIKVFEQFIHLPAQQMVNEVYRHFERLQDFELQDDFTLIILKHV